MKLKIGLFIFAIIAITLTCRGRLSPVLYQIEGESRSALKVDESYYLTGYDLSMSPDTDPVVIGRGNILITNQYREEPGKEIIETGLIKAVGEITYRIYAALPEDIAIGSMELAGKSVCRIIGMYELSEDIRHYVCHEGTLAIDTVKTSRFRAHIYGKYYNTNNDSLIFDGDLNVKKQK
jgi:hypothetical protein